MIKRRYPEGVGSKMRTSYMQIDTTLPTRKRYARNFINGVILVLSTTGCAGSLDSNEPRRLTQGPCPDLSGKYEASGPFRLTINGKVVDNPANNGIAKLIYLLPATHDEWVAHITPLLNKYGGEDGIKYISISKQANLSYEVSLFTNENKAFGSYVANVPEGATCHDGMYHWRQQRSPIHAPDIIPSTIYESMQRKLYIDNSGALVSEINASRNVLVFVVPVQSKGIVNVATFARVRSDGKWSGHE